MGTYISQSDITPGLVELQHLVQLTQDVPGSDEVDSAVLAAVITAAEAEVNGYLGVRYALPLASVPAMVKSMAARITIYRLHRRRPGSIGEDLQKDYERAVSMLEKIAAGTLALGPQPEPGENPQRVIKSSYTTPVFGRSNMGDF